MDPVKISIRNCVACNRGLGSSTGAKKIKNCHPAG